jgi:hypothetical protein
VLNENSKVMAIGNEGFGVLNLLSSYINIKTSYSNKPQIQLVVSTKEANVAAVNSEIIDYKFNTLNKINIHLGNFLELDFNLCC